MSLFFVLHGSAPRYAKLMVHLVTNETRVKKVMGAGDVVTAVMLRLHDLEARGVSVPTSIAHRFRDKEATDYKPHAWSGEKNSWSFTSQMELQDWFGSLHDNMLKMQGCPKKQRTTSRTWTGDCGECMLHAPRET